MMLLCTENPVPALGGAEFLSRTKAAPGLEQIFVMASMRFGVVVAKHADRSTASLE